MYRRAPLGETPFLHLFGSVQILHFWELKRNSGAEKEGENRGWLAAGRLPGQQCSWMSSTTIDSWFEQCVQQHKDRALSAPFSSPGSSADG